ncbi:hypothetical protein [Streptomyces axinellae]|uniref:Uncharacterized protein n=1 Tax=Streptomyces axinellae TaxID=552788 RepID=A0ABN3QBF7_9ACTN
MERISAAGGLGSAANLRRHVRCVGLAPVAYSRAFLGTGAPGADA